MVRSQWQEVPPRYACTLNTFDTRDYGYLNAIRVLPNLMPFGQEPVSGQICLILNGWADRPATSPPWQHTQRNHMLGWTGFYGRSW